MKRILVVLVALAASSAATPAVAERHHPPAPGYVRSVLTDNGPRFHYRAASGARVVIGGVRSDTGYRDRNFREVFRRPNARIAGSQTTCATWVRESDRSNQEGLAVRIRDRNGRVRAVTLTKNVEFGIYSVFNLLTWDTARRVVPWRAIGQYDLSPVVGLPGGLLAPFPWRVCLRAIGRNVQFKVWLPRDGAEPSWGDPVHVHSARLPRGFGTGRPGWYVGHLPAGGRVVYADLTTTSKRP